MSFKTKYEVKVSDKTGRCLVAATDLKPGEVIFTDKPFILGPYCDASLICFDCYRPLVNKFVCCKKCGMAPICPEEGCLQGKLKLHDEMECSIFSQLKAKGCHVMTLVQNVGSLLVARALLKKYTDPQAWEQFMDLENHLEERRNTDVWTLYENTVKFVESLQLLDDFKEDELVQKICGAIDANCFEVRGPAHELVPRPEVLRGIYLNAALLAHNCVGNSYISIDDGYCLTVRASAQIKKDDIIYYNYTNPLQGTSQRQKHLLLGKYLKCTCKRCSDPTELGSHMSSAVCSDCRTGLVSEKVSIDQKTKWVCQSCQKQYDSTSILAKVDSCYNKLEEIDKRDEQELEEYIKNASLVLAPNHYLLVEAKQCLAGVLRDAINRDANPPKKRMRRKIQLCAELLSVLDTVTPDLSRTKAITLYELHATTALLARKLFEAREIPANVYVSDLGTAEKILKRSLGMLLLEPGNSPEGLLCARALEDYRSLKSTIASVLDGVAAESKTTITQSIEVK